VVNSGVCSYPVTLQFDTPSDESLPNMAANASIITDSKDNVLLLPVNAVKTVRGETVVTVLRNGEENQLPVVAGLSSDTRVEIVSGLQEGDEVVVGTLSAGQQSASSPFGGGFSAGAMRAGGLGGGFTVRPSR
jgi:multidrug efflux pump subunit AcrA (membrane-fusion protein)